MKIFNGNLEGAQLPQVSFVVVSATVNGLHAWQQRLTSSDAKVRRVLSYQRRQ